MDASTSVTVLAGPNGSGKSTAAPWLLPEVLQTFEFVNADTIAAGLSAFDPQGAATAAGRIMLTRLKELAAKEVSFAFETTLASRTFVPWIRGLIERGYEFQLIFLWLPSPELAVARVAERVRRGGHDVPEETIRRRYDRGLNNFFRLYQPLADGWRFYDNSLQEGARLIAAGSKKSTDVLDNPAAWRSIEEMHAR